MKTLIRIGLALLGLCLVTPETLQAGPPHRVGIYADSIVLARGVRRPRVVVASPRPVMPTLVPVPVPVEMPASTPMPASYSAPSPMAGPAEPLALVNPKETATAISFLLNGRPVTMLPGEVIQLPTDRLWEITFDRGGPFGPAHYSMQQGIHTFGRTAFGWELHRSSFAASLSSTAAGLPANPLP